jgi:hypothetical protein
MFICRFRLVPRYLVSTSPSLHSHVTITQRFSSKATTPSRQCLEVPIPLHPPSSRVFHRDLPPTDDARMSGDPSEWPTQDSNEQFFTTSKKDEAKKKNDMGYSPTLFTLYAQLNVPEYSKLSIQLSSEQVRGVARRARKGENTVLDNLARNVLDSPEAVRSQLATALLSVSHLRLNPSLTESLSSCLTPDHLSSLTLQQLSHITCVLINHPSPPDTMTLLTHLTEAIARRLQSFRRETCGPSSSGGYGVPVWIFFRLIMHLSELHLREPATRVLQSLIEMAYIPPEAIQRIDQSSGDFHLIIVLTLVRSCISWKWNSRALVLLRSYLGRKPSPNPTINRLGQDVLYALMEFPTVKDLDLGVSFVKDILSSQEPILVSAGLVRQIYSTAQHLGQPQIAASLYKFTQTEPARSLHKYPLPSGTALTWFLRQLSNSTADLHLARYLAQQVADRCEPIPLADRAEFISIAAESGFASSARSLWERYSSGRGGQIVAGNAAMVVRMCSLFANLHRRSVAHNSKRTRLVDSHTVNGLHNNVDDLRISRLEDKKDFRNFAHSVLTRYRKVKEPLHDASREDLNALARANTILGHFTEAFRVLQVVVDRNQRPDLYDANVVLSAIASLNPHMALKMVRRMVTIGPKPDGISFGTVIHCAARRGNFGIIIGALRLARETGQQLTSKTVVTIIRASVAPSGADKDDIRDNLVRALEVIMANEHSNHLATVNMGRFCVTEALRADDPRLAFKFWKYVVQGRTEWDDNSHASLRRRIAGSIRSHCKEGHIGTREGQRMTYALRWGKGGHR